MDSLVIQEMEELDMHETEQEERGMQAEQKSSDGHHTAEEAASDGPGEMTCAICLEETSVMDLALVKGCEHQYCVHCILQWSLCKEWCPQCKAPFSYLITYRQLDGTLTDYAAEESVVLLKRARWFEDYLKAKEKGKAPVSADTAEAYTTATAAAVADDNPVDRDWADLYEDYVDAELEEDEEIENYYFSSAAGSARVVLGNRRLGGGGYMRSGRMYARPVSNNTATTPNKGGGGNKGKVSMPKLPKNSPVLGGAGPLATPTGCSPPKRCHMNEAAPRSGGFASGSVGGCGSAGGSSSGGSASKPGSGRRAKRNARRHAVDAYDDDYDF
eukprot:jgi/Chrzof1/10696/Cz05g09050.t1